MCGSYNIKHKNGDNYILCNFWGFGCDAVGRPIDPKPESTVRIESSAILFTIDCVKTTMKKTKIKIFFQPIKMIKNCAGSGLGLNLAFAWLLTVMIWRP